MSSTINQRFLATNIGGQTPATIASVDPQDIADLYTDRIAALTPAQAKALTSARSQP
jgi:hypothetical protein